VSARVRLALIALVVAVSSHVAAVWALPRVIMRLAFRAGEVRTGGDDRAYPFGLPAGAHHEVVMPSPDLLYTGCIYDLGKGPVEVTATVPESYWSVAFYADDTDNFFVLDDREVPSRKARVVLVAPGAARPAQANGAVVVEAPSARGLVLFRTLVLDRAKLVDLRALQRTEQCAPL